MNKTCNDILSKLENEGSVSRLEFKFPEPIPLEKKLKDILEKEVAEKYYLSNEKAGKLKFSGVSNTDVAPTLRSSRQGLKVKTANSKGYDIAEDGDGIDLAYPDSKTRRGRVGHSVSKTLETTPNNGVLDKTRIRRLTPLECWRLQGHDDADFEKAKKSGLSDTQLYKIAGNGIAKPCLEAIFKKLFL